MVLLKVGTLYHELSLVVTLCHHPSGIHQHHHHFEDQCTVAHYEKKETVTKYGEWEYNKCRVAKCFVSCGVDCVECYVDSAKRQLY